MSETVVTYESEIKLRHWGSIFIQQLTTVHSGIPLPNINQTSLNHIFIFLLTNQTLN